MFFFFKENTNLQDPPSPKDYLCDVIFQSRDEQQHSAHRLVLSAASEALQALLSGAWAESERIKKGEPVTPVKEGVGEVIWFWLGGGWFGGL